MLATNHAQHEGHVTTHRCLAQVFPFASNLAAHQEMAALGMVPTRPLALVFEKAARATSSNGVAYMRAYEVGINISYGTLCSCG